MAVRIRAAAVVEWTDTTSTPRSFHHLAGPDAPSLQLQLHVDEQKQTAIFKIRVRLDFGEGTAHHDSDYLYFWIHPSNVILLLEDPVHRLADSISAVLHNPTICLRLVLSEPAPVVVLSDFSLPLRDGPGLQRLDSMILLAKQTVLAIHVEQHHLPDQKNIQRLCQAFCDGSVKQHPRHNSLYNFYKGHDAMIIEDLAHFAATKVESTGLPADGPSNTRDAASPPPYAEPRPPSPSFFTQQRPNKRQRIATDVSATMTPDVDSTYTTLLTQQKAQMDAFLSLQQAQMAEVLARLDARVDMMPHQVVVDQRVTQEMTKILARMDAQVDRIPGQVIAQVDKRVTQEMAKIWDKRPREWEKVTRDIVQQEIDHTLETSLPKEMDDFKDDIKKECLDELKTTLEDGLVQIIIPR